MAETETVVPAKATAAKKVPAQKRAAKATPAREEVVQEKPAVAAEPTSPAHASRPRPGSWVAIKAQVLGGRGRSHVGQILVEIEGRADVQEVLVKLDRVIGPAEPPVPDEPRTKGRVVLVGGVAFQLVEPNHTRGWSGVGEEKLRTWEELHALGNVVVL